MSTRMSFTTVCVCHCAGKSLLLVAAMQHMQALWEEEGHMLLTLFVWFLLGLTKELALWVLGPLIVWWRAPSTSRLPSARKSTKAPWLARDAPGVEEDHICPVLPNNALLITFWLYPRLYE
eukprot:1159070-Pelagomonas_calceolata.AAC.14